MKKTNTRRKNPLTGRIIKKTRLWHDKTGKRRSQEKIVTTRTGKRVKRVKKFFDSKGRIIRTITDKPKKPSKFKKHRVRKLVRRIVAKFRKK